MRISKENAPTLFNEFEISNAVCKKQLPVQAYTLELFKGIKDTSIIQGVQGYVRSNGIETATAQESIAVFLDYLCRVFTKIYCNFKVEVVEQSFYDNIQYCSIEKILDNQRPYDLLGDCSGIMFFPEEAVMVEYAIQNDGVFLRYMENGNNQGKISMFFGDCDLSKIAQGEGHRIYFLATLNVLLMKKYGEVETIVVAKETIRNIEGNKVANKMPFPIRHLTSSYFKTIIRTEGFMVQGFWRKQACGKGWKEHKLIFVKSFQKHGYIRRAPAQIARATA